MTFDLMGEFDPTYFERAMSSNLSSGWNEVVIANPSGQKSNGQDVSKQDSKEFVSSGVVATSLLHVALKKCWPV